jgi:hypothetical protein
MGAFDDAWAASDAFLETEMGEELILGEARVTAVVGAPAAAGSFLGERGLRNSGIAFVVHLSLAQVQALVTDAEQAALTLKGLKVQRGAFTGKVTVVEDLGGAGLDLQVEALSSRR